MNKKNCSYNCFYSALHDIIAEKYPYEANIMINNRVQFFYRKMDFYTDDNRFVGEHIMLYDHTHLELMRHCIGVDVNISKSNKTSCFFEDSFWGNKKVLLINRDSLVEKKDIGFKRNCVTTVIVEKYDNTKLLVNVFDEDLPPTIIADIEKIYYSWINASEHDYLNGCIVEIDFLKSLSAFDIEIFGKKNAIKSIEEHLKESQSGTHFAGVFAIKVFAEDLLKWKNDIFCKLIDGSMYLKAVVKQREAFYSFIKSVFKEISLYLLNDIRYTIKQWENIRLNLYIIGNRKQFGSLQYMFDSIYKLANLEETVLRSLLEEMNHDFNK